MIEVLETNAFVVWFASLKDEIGRAMITARMLRVSRGSFGDAKPVGAGVSELRIHGGPGYRIYFVRRGQTLVVLLCGGSKSSQSRDILRAKAMADGLTAEEIQSLRDLKDGEP